MKKLVYLLSFVLTITLIAISCSDSSVGTTDNNDNGENGVATTGKKGVAFTNNAERWSHKTSEQKAHWMYSWGNQLREEIPDNVEYVPMFWGRGSVTDENINRINQLIDEGKVKYVLGFNEPDATPQANMSVDEALELWPKLEEINAPLGSPATVSPDNDWMMEFMERADNKGLRVDFIAVHHYGGTNVGNFINKLSTAYNNFGQRPIWVTEFAVADWNASTPAENRYSVAEVLDFMEQALNALDEIEWVERYAWFSGTNGPLYPSALFDEDNQITEVGEFYANHRPNLDIGPGQDTEFEPEVDPDEFVQNPGFETGQLSPWDGFKNGLIEIGGPIEPFEGNFSGRIENGDGSLFQEIEMEPGKTYRLEFYSKWRDHNPNSINPTIRKTSEGRELLFDVTNPPPTTEWEKTEFEFTLPDDIDEIRLVFYKPNGTPPFYLDNVSIRIKDED